MSNLFQKLRVFLSRATVQEALRWSVPALGAGLVLRLVLSFQMPFGVYHDDSTDLLQTVFRLIAHHRWEIHGKKTFLVPLVYSILGLLHLPILLVVPWLQHALGLGIVAMTGGLCRLWFSRWKWFIIPVTLVVALDPWLLWYEKTLMAETPFLFAVVLLALAGTMYARRRSTERFVFLCAALVLCAGGRPEGKLLFGFALFLLALLHARRWRREWLPFTIVLFLGLGLHFVTKTTQAGLLLFTSVARLAPTDLHSAPGFEKYFTEIRNHLDEKWAGELGFPKVQDRKAIAGAVEDYLSAANNPKSREVGHRSVNDICLQMAAETCKRNLPALPAYVYQKFRATARFAPSGMFDEEWLFERQEHALGDNLEQFARISTRITGRSFTTTEEYSAWVHAHYRVLPWYNAYSEAWRSALDWIRLPDERRLYQQKLTIIPRLPAYFLVATLGLVVMMFRRGLLQPFHLAWGLTLLAFFFTIILTANVKPRFRFAFEPFWYTYVALLADCLLAWLWPQRPALIPPDPVPVSVALPST